MKRQDKPENLSSWSVRPNSTVISLETNSRVRIVLIKLFSFFIFFLPLAAEVQGDEISAAQAPAGAEVTDVGPDDLKDINFDDG